MSSREPLTLAFSVDASYVAGAAVVIASLRAHTPPERPLEVWVVHSELDGHGLALLQRAAAQSDAALHLRSIARADLELPVRSDYISVATFGRLFLGSLLPASLRRVLYLDGDLLVVGALGELWQTDLAGNVVGAVPEATKGVLGRPRTYEHPLDPGLDPLAPYFNAGVLLIDLPLWRRHRIGERAVAYIQANRPPLMDQDGLNATLRGSWLPLDRMWNVTTYWFRSPSRQRRYRSLLGRARIAHYVGHRKPWLRDDVWRAAEWRAHFDRISGGAVLPRGNRSEVA